MYLLFFLRSNRVIFLDKNEKKVLEACKLVLPRAIIFCLFDPRAIKTKNRLTRTPRVL